MLKDLATPSLFDIRKSIFDIPNAPSPPPSNSLIMATEIINNASNETLGDDVIESIKQVYDPEIPINVYDLGLIYKVQLDPDDRVFVTMTLTSPNCPAAGILPSQIESVVMLTEGVTDARVEITFDPPFTIDMMSDEAKLELGFL